MNCPYSDEELEEWEDASNPMGKECLSCDELDCQHNLNSGEVESDSYEEVSDNICWKEKLNGKIPLHRR